MPLLSPAGHTWCRRPDPEPVCHGLPSGPHAEGRPRVGLVCRRRRPGRQHVLRLAGGGRSSHPLRPPQSSLRGRQSCGPFAKISRFRSRKKLFISLFRPIGVTFPPVRGTHPRPPSLGASFSCGEEVTLEAAPEDVGPRLGPDASCLPTGEVVQMMEQGDLPGKDAAMDTL